jgi:hypothetical protein
MDNAKQILMNRIRTRLKTTFIGSIDLLENRLKDILSEEEFIALRKAILDLGNHQIREMEKELTYYQVDFSNSRFYIEDKNGGNSVQRYRFKE